MKKNLLCGVNLRNYPYRSRQNYLQFVFGGRHCWCLIIRRRHFAASVFARGIRFGGVFFCTLAHVQPARRRTAIAINFSVD